MAKLLSVKVNPSISPMKPPSNFIAGRPKVAILFCLLLVVLFSFLLACFIVVVSICLVCNSSIVATCPTIQLPALLFVCVLFLLFIMFYLENQTRTKGEVGRPQTNSSPPVILLLAVPRRLFFLGSLVVFRCGVIYRYSCYIFI